MCDFCERDTEYNMEFLGKNYEFCGDCWPKAKACDGCDTLHVFGSTISFVREVGKFLCVNCTNEVTKTCVKCGSLHMENGDLCKSCEEKYFTCEVCGEVKTRFRSMSTKYQRLAYSLPKNTCSLCVTRKRQSGAEFVTPKICKHCSNFHVESNDYCSECQPFVHTCSDCGDVFCATNPRYVDDEIKCDKCAAKYFKECDRCHDEVMDTKRVPDTNLIFCTHCYRHKVSECSVCHKEKFDLYDEICQDCRKKYGVGYIRNYSEKMPVHLNGKDIQPHYGIENEINMCGDYIPTSIGVNYLSKEYSNHDLILKQDSTIKNGFECVWRPFTFKEFNDFDFSRVFNEEIFRWYEEIDSEDNIRYTCGMHVHINKSSFKTAHMYKFMQFIYENDDLIFHIAERKAGAYCNKNRDSIKMMAKEKHTGERGQIALTDKTVEVRIFKGTDNEAQFRKNVEFIDALYYYTLNNSIINATSVPSFIKSINKKDYPNLHAFLKGGCYGSYLQNPAH